MARVTCDAPTQPVDRPAHAQVKPASHGVLEHLVERRALIPALGAADAGVLVRLDDLPATMSGDLDKRQTLIPRGLAVGDDDSEVECEVVAQVKTV